MLYSIHWDKALFYYLTLRNKITLSTKQKKPNLSNVEYCQNKAAVQELCKVTLQLNFQLDQTLSQYRIQIYVSIQYWTSQEIASQSHSIVWVVLWLFFPLKLRKVWVSIGDTIKHILFWEYYSKEVNTKQATIEFDFHLQLKWQVSVVEWKNNNNTIK